MPLYHFQISRNGQPTSLGQHIELPDRRAAWTEATTMCRDLSRDMMDQLEANPEWQMAVTDAAGRLLYRFRFTAESFGPVQD